MYSLQQIPLVTNTPQNVQNCILPETSSLTREPLVLAFDTSGPYCAATLTCADVVIAECAQEMTRGQAERLFPLLQEVMAAGDTTWSQLDAIGVGTGPGNFTGIRVSVSAARGLALGLNIPAVGVDGFEARATVGCLTAIPAPRDHVYAQIPTETAPRLMPVQEAEDSARDAGLTIAPAAMPLEITRRIAALAAQRYRCNPGAPAPLYLRAADAAPARDSAPDLLDD